MAGPITGVLGAFQQPGRWGRNEAGNYTLWSFEGTKQEVNNLAAVFAQTLGLVYEVTESFGKNRLEVHIPWNPGIDPRTDRVDLWEFFAQHVEKDLLEARVENPNTIALLTDDQVDRLRNLLQDPPQPTDPPVAATNFQKSGENATQAANALAIYKLMQKGVRNFPVEAPCLRHTLTTSNQYAIAYALSNVRRIMSTPTLVSLEQMPAGLLFNLPVEISSDSSLAYGWYKMFPTIQQIALQKWQIQQEWQYGLWATLIWGNPL